MEQGDDRRLSRVLVWRNRKTAVVANGAAIDGKIALADIARVAVAPGAGAAFADFVAAIRVGIEDRFWCGRAGVDERSMRAGGWVGQGCPCWRRAACSVEFR
ncbi:hypothetical protein ATY79_07990 [Rhizobium sp. R693]|nr:hypothetical protein ATY79_07990 [Rhizobium sp. R693]